MRGTSTFQTELGTLPVFATCTRKQMAEVSRLVTVLHVKDGKILALEGTQAREVVIVLEGSATVARNGTVISRLRRGDLIGENAILRGATRSATVSADGPMVIGVLNPLEFDSLLDAVPGVAHSLAISLARRLKSQLATERSENDESTTSADCRALVTAGSHSAINS